jgi:hypothetical protein
MLLPAPLEPLDELARSLLGNPFTGAWMAARRKMARSLQDLSVMELLRSRTASGHRPEAIRLLLAWRLLQALDEGDAEERGAAPRTPRPVQVPSVLYRDLGLHPDRVDRVLAAAIAGRDRISRIRGSSLAAKTLRRATWEAALGNDLARLDPLTPHLRRMHVVVHGETGTGKELVAQAILWATPAADAAATAQTGAPRRHTDAPRVTANVAELHDQTIESELFGHVRGAFTGAARSRAGLLREAHGGSIFLDEVAELPQPSQAKLLRVMQQLEVRPMGAERGEPADLRYVAATHRPLETEGPAAPFRADFLHRLAGVVVRVPPLRERREDIPEIVEAMLAGPAGSPSADAIHLDELKPLLSASRFQDYEWPGNVRELERVVRRYLLTGSTELGILGGTTAPPPDVPAPLLSCRWTEDELCRWYARRARASSADSDSAVARRLGIDRGTLARRLEERQ